ncbi:ARM repeat-containing protein [Tilletiaria anomala UBC 951]|uniref:ARM repeat-containing protein n=1 Tax=Tilletiaria anomala (strain ATCC 24038 / CBS 436.72 / UBC 951) TaxID=1037660 RepID=A0A066WAC1_TILAU|nr:ARM repeat-containing protein [Tilletiaria anomala UBC 951]KDN47725.1 ARM repeat-containing protein [Tilletiaria anomala UBC 951]
MSGLSGLAEQSGAEQAAASTLLHLRNIRNSIIGSSNRKVALVASQPLTEFIELLSTPLGSPLCLEVRTQAATVLGSLAQSASTSKIILYSLLKEPIVSALLASLSELAHEDVLLVRDPTSDAAQDTHRPHIQNEAVRAIEANLRALKALYTSSSSFVTPSVRWGLGSGHGFIRGTDRSTCILRSARSIEVISARYRPQGDPRTQFDNGSADTSNGRLKLVSTPPRSEIDDGELRILIRAAIAELYTPTHLQLLLSCLFLSRLVDGESEDAAYDLIGDLSSSATIKAYGTQHADAHSLARSPSNMSLASDIGPSNARPQAQGTDVLHNSLHSNKDHLRRGAQERGDKDLSSRRRPSNLSQLDQTRLTGVAETVCVILSTTLGTPSGPISADASVSQLYGVTVPHQNEGKSASGTEASTPLEEIAERRKRVLAFTDENDSVLRARKLVEGDFILQSSEESSAAKLPKGKEREVVHVDMEMGDDATMDNVQAQEARGRLESRPAGMAARLMSLPGTDRSKSRPRRREEEGSVLERLIYLVECESGRTQEAALWAIAELVRENAEASVKFFKCQMPSGILPTTMLLRLRNERSVPIRLAAFCSLAHIIKVHPFTPQTNAFVLGELISLLSHTDDVSVQIQACFSLARLIADDAELQTQACEGHDCMRKLASLLQSTSAAAATQSEVEEAKLTGGWRPDELILRLREGALTALAALTYEQDDIRRMLVDMNTPSILPMVVPLLTAAALGVRVAACRLVRSLSRSVSILRTSLVDAGAASRLITILKDDAEEEIVKTEVIATICNLALKFSPMKQLLVESGGLAKLVTLAKVEKNESIRLNALWALKNILYSSDTETKKTVVEALTFHFIADLARARSAAIQEQALNIIRNLASSREADIELAMQGFGEDKLFELIENVIWAGGEDAVIEHAAFILVNIATGSEDHRRAIITRPNILDALLYFLGHRRARIRDAGVWCAVNLTFRMPNSAGKKAASPLDAAAEALSRLRAFGFPEKLRELVVEEETLDVRDRAQTCLARFEQAF